MPVFDLSHRRQFSDMRRIAHTGAAPGRYIGAHHVRQKLKTSKPSKPAAQRLQNDCGEPQGVARVIYRDRYEAGMALTGWKFKEPSRGRGQLKESYLFLRDGVLFFWGSISRR